MLSGIFLSSCIFSGEGETAGLRSGVYQADYGAVGRELRQESELVLDPEGRFHFFQVVDTTPRIITKGNWEYRDGMLIENSAVMRIAHYTRVFDSWEKNLPDTSYVRSLSDVSFEHLEITLDSASFRQVVRWVPYHRIQPVAKLPVGRYEFSETYPDAQDSTKSHSGTAYLVIDADGSYRDGRSEDGKPLWEFESPQGFLSGSYLIAHGGRVRSFGDTGFMEWETFSADTAAEYVVRVRAIAADSFQQWVPEDQSFQPFEHWMTWRRRR